MKAKIEGTVTKPGSMIGGAAKSSTGKMIGGYAFLAGFLIAVLAGLLAGLSAIGVMSMDPGSTGILTGILVVIGLIVGIVNISDKEAINFLIAAIAISAPSAAITASGSMMPAVEGLKDIVGLNAVAAFLSAMMGMIAVFVAPAAIIVALKVIYNTSRGA